MTRQSKPAIESSLKAFQAKQEGRAFQNKTNIGYSLLLFYRKICMRTPLHLRRTLLVGTWTTCTAAMGIGRKRCTLRSRLKTRAFSSAARKRLIQNLKSACFSQSAQTVIAAPTASESISPSAHAEIVSYWKSTPATLKQPLILKILEFALPSGAISFKSK